MAEPSEREEFAALRPALWPSDEPDALWETELLERLVAALPGDAALTSALANHYSDWGRIRESVAMDRRTVELLPRSPTAWYNLACSCSLAQRAPEAVRALERAVELGFDDWTVMAEDDDLEWLRERPEYGRVARLARRGDSDGAGN